MITTPCKGCGRPIVWAKNEGQGGRPIPLDPRPVVYAVQKLGEDLYAKAQDRTAQGGFMISHFITCPNRDLFSSSRKPEGG